MNRSLGYAAVILKNRPLHPSIHPSPPLPSSFYDDPTRSSDTDTAHNRSVRNSTQQAQRPAPTANLLERFASRGPGSPFRGATDTTCLWFYLIYLCHRDAGIVEQTWQKRSYKPLPLSWTPWFALVWVWRLFYYAIYFNHVCSRETFYHNHILSPPHLHIYLLSQLYPFDVSECRGWRNVRYQFPLKYYYFFFHRLNRREVFGRALSRPVET